MATLDRLRVLVIESQPTMRTQLRTMLSSAGIEDVSFAVSAGMAVRRLREQRYDLVLCEYHLGEGQDGQHLLEDLRSNEIIPLATLFIMITGERNYERVVSAAELAPNDYILKPLTSETLRVRLLRAVEKRDAFLPIWRLMEIGDTVGAIDYCKQAEDTHPQYIIDFLRLEAELHAALGHVEQAETLYRQILESRAIPWARLGLARILIQRKRHDDAADILDALIADNENYIDAYDLLARLREETGQVELARVALQAATARSPHRLARLRHLGAVSLQLGDASSAEAVMAEVVRKGKYSDFRDPEDHVRLVQSQLSQGKLDDAVATIADLDKSMGRQPKAVLCRSLSTALLCARQGDIPRAQEALLALAQSSAGSSELSVALKQELVKACVDNNLGKAASEVALDILRNAGDERTLESTRAVLKSRGLAELSQQIEQRIQAEVKSLVATGAEKARAGDYDGAVSEMMNAARKMPGNPHVLFNAALALLRHIEHRGWNERFAAQARNLIARATKLAPGYPKLAAIADFMHTLIEHYGIRPDATQEAARRARA
ncbi:tetratricopeptide repeat-containing response regulator [Azoarcus olearius]|uniref:Response regulator containing a tpr-domain n=1 Tax=Azoarcus sp. (strain BH72) TaxID=418699 RepID=A1KAK0_AZOSB|nr:tetratricopeptide repeat-containing response regulator [Azoarcus olearius]ANQ86398.1 response regulator [Azoarcus olearius]CAL95856.1 putative response regulator containing a tpr-domain [Azoarcus olearius]